MNKDVERIVQRWWQSMFLSPDELKKSGLFPAPTAHKAQLKRCDSIDAAMLTEGFRKLWFSLPEELTQTAKSTDIECWATIAAALVHVKNDSKNKLAEAAGSKAGGEKSIVSELRFAQLQDAKTADDFLRRLRRILQQIKGDISVVSLTQDIEQWFKEHRSLMPRKADKRIAVQWAMDYYRSASKK
ncbi:MAG: type I-E CRISPR-associated protein Cse2/CasB [Pseudomonas sp.]|nr:type I-E CRISPR-associated protein Cse2/CasB [Pseudomonas sp.]